MKITATIIKKALQHRHKKDVCLSECKTGPSWDNPKGVKIIDFWAMARSWSKPAVWGYEVKVSRQDFLKDDKWQAYLPYCTDFYFVCPAGIIEPNELPQDVGLLIISKNGARLYCKRKAVRRHVAIPESLYRYILMSRAEIGASTYFRDELTKKEFWQQWLIDKQVDKRFGRMVSVALATRIKEEILAVRRENDRLQSQISGLEEIKRFARANGVDLDSRYGDGGLYRLRQVIKDMEGGVPQKLLNQIQAVAADLQQIHEKITEASVS